MRSLSSLVSGSGPTDQLSSSIRALLDSGMVITLRDGVGHFVQSSPVFSQLLGIDSPPEGRTRADGIRYFEPSGREIPAREHPAHVARTTGEPQRNQLLGYRTRNGAEIWLQSSFVPIEQRAEGWSVLSIGADVTPLRTRIVDLEVAVEARDRLLALAPAFATGPRTRAEVARAIAPALEEALPTANIFFGLLVPEGIHIEHIARRFPNEFDGRIVRLSAEAASRGASRETHVNLDVQDTDIYGDRVMAEWRNSFGSIAVVPMYRSDGSWCGSLLALEPERDAFRPEQVRLLEAAARVAAVGLERATAADAA